MIGGRRRPDSRPSRRRCRLASSRVEPLTGADVVGLGAAGRGCADVDDRVRRVVVRRRLPPASADPLRGGAGAAAAARRRLVAVAPGRAVLVSRRRLPPVGQSAPAPSAAAAAWRCALAASRPASRLVAASAAGLAAAAAPVRGLPGRCASSPRRSRPRARVSARCRGRGRRGLRGLRRTAAPLGSSLGRRRHRRGRAGSARPGPARPSRAAGRRTTGGWKAAAGTAGCGPAARAAAAPAGRAADARWRAGDAAGTARERPAGRAAPRRRLAGRGDGADAAGRARRCPAGRARPEGRAARPAWPRLRPGPCAAGRAGAACGRRRFLAGRARSLAHRWWLIGGLTVCSVARFRASGQSLPSGLPGALVSELTLRAARELFVRTHWRGWRRCGALRLQLHCLVCCAPGRCTSCRETGQPVGLRSGKPSIRSLLRTCRGCRCARHPET